MACGTSETAGASAAAAPPRIRSKRSTNDGGHNVMADPPHAKREQRPHKIARGGPPRRSRPGHGGHSNHGTVTTESVDVGEDKVESTPEAWMQPTKAVAGARQVWEVAGARQVWEGSSSYHLQAPLAPPVWHSASNMGACTAWQQSTLLNEANAVVADMQQSALAAERERERESAAPKRGGPDSFGWQQDLDDMAFNRNCRESQHFAFPDLYVREASHDTFGVMHHEPAQHGMQHSQHLQHLQHHRSFRLNFAPLQDAEVTREPKSLLQPLTVAMHASSSCSSPYRTNN